MIRHLTRLVWSRRRANALIAAEMLASFLVLLGVLSAIRARNWALQAGVPIVPAVLFSMP